MNVWDEMHEDYKRELEEIGIYLPAILRRGKIEGRAVKPSDIPSVVMYWDKKYAEKKIPPHLYNAIRNDIAEAL